MWRYARLGAITTRTLICSDGSVVRLDVSDDDMPVNINNKDYKYMGTEWTESGCAGGYDLVDPTLGLAAYDNTTLQLPQRCAATALQPPVSTIAAVCSRRWPLPNTTVTGSETCGGVASSNRLTLRYLNEINAGLCPTAATRVEKGMRLCIQPPSSVAAAATKGHHRRAVLSSWTDDVIQHPALMMMSGNDPGSSRARMLLSATAAITFPFSVGVAVAT
ncbi:hypothetical protein HXX76_010463 [Chlamydomonas incerta]|uniref:LysM domain-containing protein n=1 Tax=Chlamydomonas incerta TaxID=51695 RepID=A0A835SXH2_CHLIN|nr:hypothetical protein HXX76_010463 [Chlamydomonas incerta]|eukprot:KAG2428315.1 hypothetical protein HXX76_010463 [Chlamydomonas incerta]